MTDWGHATGDAVTRKAWAKKWWITAQVESFFYDRGLIGKDASNDIIVEFADLMKDQGDVVNYGQIRDLSGAGVSADGAMETAEEEPSTYDDDLTLGQKRNAIRSEGRLSGQRPADAGMREHANRLLNRWMAATIDQDLFTALATSPTKVIYGGDATSTGTIEEGDFLTLAKIDAASTYSKKATPEIVGKSMKGSKQHVIVMAPDQASDIRLKDAAWSQAQREAKAPGDNPVFKKTMGIWASTAMFEHQRVATATTWGTGGALNGATALFLGAGAGAIAYAKKKTWNEKTFDYANKTGFCVGSVYGVSKSVFNSLDNAVIALRTFRTSN